MKVAFCVYGYSPEVERLQPWLTLHEVASVLIDSGWEVHLITDVGRRPTLEGLQHHYVSTLRPSNETNVRSLLDTIAPDRVVVMVTPLSLMFSSWYKYVSCRLIAFIAYPFYTRAELLRALPHLGRKDIVTYGRHALVPKPLWAGTLKKYYSTVIAQSERTVNRVACAAGSAVESYALHAGLDLDFWTPGGKQVPEADTVTKFLYVGSAKAIRGFDVLLDAFRYLEGHDAELRILARGSTPAEVTELRRKVDARVGGNCDRIEIIGGWMEREAYREELRAAHVAVLPFVLVPSELPVSVIECIACGTPVIATNIDGLPDAVGDAGLIVRSGSAVALAKAMKRLSTDSELLAYLRDYCVEARKKMLNWSDVGLEWKRVLS